MWLLLLLMCLQTVWSWMLQVFTVDKGFLCQTRTFGSERPSLFDIHYTKPVFKRRSALNVLFCLLFDCFVSVLFTAIHSGNRALLHECIINSFIIYFIPHPFLLVFFRSLELDSCWRARRQSKLTEFLLNNVEKLL